MTWEYNMTTELIFLKHNVLLEEVICDCKINFFTSWTIGPVAPSLSSSPESMYVSPLTLSNSSHMSMSLHNTCTYCNISHSSAIKTTWPGKLQPNSLTTQNHVQITEIQICTWTSLKLRLTTRLNKNARPVAPVKRVDISSARFVRGVSQLAHRKILDPPRWLKNMRPMLLRSMYVNACRM